MAWQNKTWGKAPSGFAQVCAVDTCAGENDKRVSP